MRRIITVLIGMGGLSFGLAHTAIAADMAPVYKAPTPMVAPVYNWSGFYLGGFVGGLWSEKDWTEIVGPIPGASIHPNLSGFIGGGQAGFNFQTGNWVLGVEGDFGWTNADGSSNCVVGPPFTCTARLDWIGTLNGRIGYAWDRVLVYGKGGFAWGHDVYHATRGALILNTATDDRTGWTVGAGLEYGFTPNWSAKVEYNYIDFGTDRLTFSDGAVEDLRQSVHVVKFGINYRFY